MKIKRRYRIVFIAVALSLSISFFSKASLAATTTTVLSKPEIRIGESGTAGNIQITEQSAGALSAMAPNNTIVLQCPPGVSFSSIPAGSVTSGDLILEGSNPTLLDTNGDLLNDRAVWTISGASTTASTIFIITRTMLLDYGVMPGDVLVSLTSQIPGNPGLTESSIAVATAEADWGAIRGVVTREADGQPLSGIWIYASDYYTGGWGGSTQSHADGSYVISGLEPGNYRVFVRATDTDFINEYYNNSYYSNLAQLVSVTTGQTTSGINFNLEVGWSISGTVTREFDGQPLEVPVNVYDYASGNWMSGGFSGSDGLYVIRGLPSGSYRVEAVNGRSDYAKEYYNNTFYRNLAEPVPVAAGQNTVGIDFSLALGGSISGVITRESDGLPISGIIVNAFDFESGVFMSIGGTQTDGIFVIWGLPQGNFRVEASTRGTDYVREYYNNTTDWNSAQSVPVMAQQTTSDVNFLLALGGSISGSVYRESDGQPIAGLWIYAYDYATGNWGGSGQSISDGSYVIRGLAQGTYRISAGGGSSNYQFEYYDNTSVWDLCKPVSVVIEQNTTEIDFSLSEAGSISGTITRESDGQPISGLSVTVNVFENGNLVGQTKTRGDGSYTMRGLASGNYRVEVSTQGTDYIREYYNDTHQFSSAQPVPVTAGQTTSGIDFILAVGSSISGVVTSASDGQPVQGVYVSCSDYSNGTSWGGAQTQSDGSYTIRGVPIGSYRIQVSTQGTDFAGGCFGGSSGQCEPVSVAEGQPTTGIDFQLSPGGHISGRVTRASDGQPVSGLYVYAYESQTGSNGNAMIQPDGSYTIRGLSTGNYTVYISSWGTDYIGEYYNNSYSYYTAQVVPVTAGQTTAGIDFTLEVGGSISGTVTRASDGQPVANMQITAYQNSTGQYVNSTFTLENGFYDIKGLPAGTYRVETFAWGTDYAGACFGGNDQCEPVSVSAGQTTEGIDFHISTLGSISGVVTREHDGQPIAGLWVYANGFGYGAQTNEDGSYTITRLPAGNYHVFVETTGTDYIREHYPNAYGMNSAEAVSVSLARDTSGVDFSLTVGQTISGVVTGQTDQAPIASIQVYACENISWGCAGGTTQEDGSYVIRGLPVGSYRVEAQASGTEFADACFNESNEQCGSVLVTSDHPATAIDFSLPIGGSISGVVTRDSDGKPLEGFIIVLYGPDSSFSSSRQSEITGQDGRYTVKGLKEGEYHVGAYFSEPIFPPGYEWEYFDNSYSLDSATPVHVNLGQATGNIDFSLALWVDSDGDYVADPRDLFPENRAESADTDGDGTGDNADPDDDNDGMPDVWEIAHGIDYLKANADADEDGDGLSNIDEYREGTNPVRYTLLSQFSLALPVIDGILSPGEWPEESRLTLDSGQGDLCYFYMMYDRENLYIAVSAIDDTTDTTPEDTFSTGTFDNMAIWFGRDGADIPGDEKGLGFWLYGNGHLRAERISWKSDSFSEFTSNSAGAAAGPPDAAHMTYELRIPLSELTPMISGKSIRAGIHYWNDYNSGPSFWGPDRANVYTLGTYGELVLATIPEVPGDINGDGRVDMADAILSLMILTNAAGIPPVRIEADINGDLKIGPEETVYILQKISGGR